MSLARKKVSGLIGNAKESNEAQAIAPHSDEQTDIESARRERLRSFAERFRAAVEAIRKARSFH